MPALPRNHVTEIVKAALKARSTKSYITYEGLASIVERLVPDDWSKGMDAARSLLNEIPCVKEGRRAGREIWKFGEEKAVLQAIAEIEVKESFARVNAMPSYVDQVILDPSQPKERREQFLRFAKRRERLGGRPAPKPRRGRPPKDSKAMTGAERQRALQERRREAERTVREAREYLRALIDRAMSDIPDELDDVKARLEADLIHLGRILS